MESDLKSQLDALLDRLSTDSHVTDSGRQSLQRWLVDTLETERRGWKGRLKDAARAADIEHRQTLAAHTAIQQVIASMVNRLPATSAADVTDELMASRPTDDDDGNQTDRKSDRLSQLERYWAAVDRYISHLESERTGCFRVLGFPDEETAVDLHAALKDRLGDVEKEAARKSFVASLTAENGELRDRLRAVVRSERVAKERHNRESADLKKTTMKLEQHLLKQTELIERLSVCVDRRDEAVQTDLIRRVPPAQGARFVARGGLVASRQQPQQQQLQHHEYSIGSVTQSQSDQSAVGIDPTASTTHRRHSPSATSTAGSGSNLLPSIRAQLLQQQHQQQQQHESDAEVMSVMVRNSEDFYRKYSVVGQPQKQHSSGNNTTSSSTSFPPVSGATVPPYETNAATTSGGTVAAIVGVKRPATGQLLHHQQQATAVVLPSIVAVSMTAPGEATNSGSGETRHDWNHTYSPSFLRGQVLSFASKLEETKREMDACQRELVRLKATAFGQSQTDVTRTKQHVINDTTRRRRHQQQRQTLAAKSVTTLHLPPVDVLSSSPRNLHDNESSRATESTWRAADVDADVHYAMYARRQRNVNGGKHWRQ